jgi:hypothetical protein
MTTVLNRRPGVPGRVVSERRPEPAGFLAACPGYRSTALLDRLAAPRHGNGAPMPSRQGS